VDPLREFTGARAGCGGPAGDFFFALLIGAAARVRRAMGSLALAPGIDDRGAFHSVTSSVLRRVRESCAVGGGEFFVRFGAPGRRRRGRR
jgi:hypothetical protein